MKKASIVSTLIALVAASGHLCAMSTSTTSEKSIPKAFPENIYDNAYQGASYHYSHNLNKLTQEKQRALTMTRELADKEKLEDEKKEEERRVILDWLYALQMAEKELLTKPFTTWTIEDITKISTWLNRLSTKVTNPSAFRKEPRHWDIRELSEEEDKKAKNLVTRSVFSRIHSRSRSEVQKHIKVSSAMFVPITKDEQAFLDDAIYQFCYPQQIKPALAGALLSAQQNLKNFEKVTSDEERTKKIFPVGTKFHFDCVKVHPLQEGNKRLGRLCMFIIHYQYGIEPFPIEYNGRDYVHTLIESLKMDSSKPFEDFYNTFHTALSQANERAFNIFNSSENMNFMDFLEKMAQENNVPLEKVFSDPQFQALITGVAASQQAEEISCAQCGAQDATKQCGKCHQTRYCSTTCQRAHWKAHKESCCK